MGSLMILLLSLLAITSASGDTSLKFQPSTCRCQDVSWCKPIRGKSSSKEVVGFTYGTDVKYQLFDWKKLTTVVIFAINSHVTPDLVCEAHKNNVKVQLLVRCSTTEVVNSDFRKEFVNKAMGQVKEYHLDGINIDFEGLVSRNGSAYNALTDLVREFRISLKKASSNYQLSMDYVYCPYCSTRRTYDIMTIRHYIDYFILMDYDMQGTMYSSDANEGNDHLCWRLINSPLPVVEKGVREFIGAGISGSQLVTAFPWYGVNYPCNVLNNKTNRCYTDCNNRWKSKYTLRFNKVMSLKRSNANIKSQWNPRTSTPFFNYKNTDGRMYQVNYDDPASLSLKYKLSVTFQLRGVGMWNIDFLDYTNNVNGTLDRHRMWGAIPSY